MLRNLSSVLFVYSSPLISAERYERRTGNRWSRGSKHNKRYDSTGLLSDK
jgi:hypothetical protein